MREVKTYFALINLNRSGLGAVVILEEKKKHGGHTELTEEGRMVIALKKGLISGDFWFKCTACGSSVARLPWEHRGSDQPSFPTQTHCKHSHLKLRIQLEE